MRQTTLVATLTSAPPEEPEELAALLEEVEVLEVRADLVGDLDIEGLRDRFDGRLLYTLRSRAEGGAFAGGRAARERRLTEAAERYDLVDLEVDRDAYPELLDAVPADRRLISWHGPAASLAQLEGRFEAMAEHAAVYYKLVPTAAQAVDALRPLALLRALRRDDVVAFSGGEIGAWTRPLAPRLGSPLVYGALGDEAGAPGQPTVERLRADFGLPELPPAERLFGLCGKPVAHSLSPRLHNGAYRALGLGALYLPFHVESFGDFWLDVVESGALAALGVPLAGLSVTSPHKEAALAVAGAASPRTERIGAANTLVLQDGVWEAETTDPDGVVNALTHRGVALDGYTAAVVGCGGAGRAAALGLALAGADVTLVNRGAERGERAAAELELPFVPLADFDPGAFSVVVQATPLGHDDDDPPPVAAADLAEDAALVDLVYGDRPTALVRAARRRGLVAVDGREVLLFQALDQFRLMTGRPMRPELARRLLQLDGADSESGEAEGAA